MHRKIIPALLIALTFGLLACSSTSPLIEKTQNKITSKKYEAAIAAAEKFIQKKPNNPLGYYYLAVALGQKGQAVEPPSESTVYFKRMNEKFQKAKELASQAKKAPEEISRIKNVQTSFWRFAYNKGVKLIQNDSLRNTFKNPLQRSLAFLQNAAIIQPTHPMTYQAIAIVSARLQEYAQAAKAQKRFVQKADSVSVRNYLVLTQYYQRADMSEEALQALKTARDRFPNNTQIMAFLADTYTQLGKTEKAIALVETLVEKNPENPQYHLSLGSRILIASTQLQNEFEDIGNKIFELMRKLEDASGAEAQQIKQKIDSLRQESQKLIQKIRQLQDRAEKQFRAVLKYKPNSAKAYHYLGVVFQNRAAIYYDLRNRAQERAQAKKYDQKADELLREAMTYYQKAVEIEPENRRYWRSLFVVYTTLGLDKKAQKAAQKAGIN